MGYYLESERENFSLEMYLDHMLAHFNEVRALADGDENASKQDVIMHLFVLHQETYNLAVQMCAEEGVPTPLVGSMSYDGYGGKQDDDGEGGVIRT